ncbi:glycoside hydrolase [Amylocystis lapponica]|nr:glycoside hydrolase [Amylocystis lapponica]
MRTPLFSVSAFSFVFAPVLSVFGAGLQPQIPAVASFTAGQGVYELLPNVQIVVDSAHAHDGSPSAYDFAQTFRADLMSVAGYAWILPVEVLPEEIWYAPTIHIIIDPSLSFTHYNGKSTLEGYEFEITESTYTIKAAGAIGAWWGTRTLLQQAALTLADGAKSITFPQGSGSDVPGWEIRGVMLDAGRHYFKTDFLADLCIYASFFKINEFQLHSSDNLWNPAISNPGDYWKELYAGFRFQPPAGSPVAGIVPSHRMNETWTKEEFTAMQEICTQHGVTILPEIESPGHSLVINQWKPELMLSGSPDELNLSYPDTIPTIKSLWQEFLPWFTGPETSIGADEYVESLGTDYVNFVNEMSEFIHAESGKSIRIWGTLEPSNVTSVSKNITIQHWDFPDDDLPVQLMAEGYYVINSEQHYLYLDGKSSDGGQFPQTLDLDVLFTGAPGGAGWAPNIFSPQDSSNNTTPENPMLRGSIMALWNDWGNNASTDLEEYYQLSQSLAVFSEKAWTGSGQRSSELSLDQFLSVYPALNAAAPGQNLNRVVKPEYGNVVYSYPGTYNTLTTPYASVGPNYTMKFSVQPSADAPDTGLLFSGTDSQLWVANLTFEATGQLYPLGYVLPEGKYTTVEIHATRDWTYAIIDGDTTHPYYWQIIIDFWGDYSAPSNMSFAAPSQYVGGQGFSGSIRDISLILGA